MCQGTTGNPKGEAKCNGPDVACFDSVLCLGVVMTHGMMANAVHAQAIGYGAEEIPVSIGFLPLAHCYGVRVSHTMYHETDP